MCANEGKYDIQSMTTAVELPSIKRKNCCVSASPPFSNVMQDIYISIGGFVSGTTTFTFLISCCRNEMLK